MKKKSAVKKITDSDVKHIATLSALPLNDKLATQMAESLSSLISFVGEIQDLELKGIKPTAQVTGKKNEFRDDVVKQSLTQKKSLSGARHIHKGYFLVPRILHEE